MSAMKLDEKALEAGARKEAEIDGRDFDALGRADKQRYIDRLSDAIGAALTSATPPDVAGLIDVLVECAEMVEDGRQDGLTQFWHDETAKLTAKTCLEAATALRLSAGGGWRSMDSAPELDRVIVAGWQKPTRSCAGYWWMHEDVIINGRPDERPDALLWHPFPARPTGLPASPTVEAGR